MLVIYVVIVQCYLSKLSKANILSPSSNNSDYNANKHDQTGNPIATESTTTNFSKALRNAELAFEYFHDLENVDQLLTGLEFIDAIGLILSNACFELYEFGREAIAFNGSHTVIDILCTQSNETGSAGYDWRFQIFHQPDSGRNNWPISTEFFINRNWVPCGIKSDGYIPTCYATVRHHDWCSNIVIYEAATITRQDAETLNTQKIEGTAVGNATNKWEVESVLYALEASSNKCKLNNKIHGSSEIFACYDLMRSIEKVPTLKKPSSLGTCEFNPVSSGESETSQTGKFECTCSNIGFYRNLHFDSRSVKFDNMDPEDFDFRNQVSFWINYLVGEEDQHRQTQLKSFLLSQILVTINLDTKQRHWRAKDLQISLFLKHDRTLVLISVKLKECKQREQQFEEFTIILEKLIKLGKLALVDDRNQSIIVPVQKLIENIYFSSYNQTLPLLVISVVVLIGTTFASVALWKHRNASRRGAERSNMVLAS